MDYLYEQKALDAGYKVICGIDEAGRGPLAGPVHAAAVVLPLGLEIEGLNDSKKLTEKKKKKPSKHSAFYISMLFLNRRLTNRHQLKFHYHLPMLKVPDHLNQQHTLLIHVYLSNFLRKPLRKHLLHQ